MSWVCVCILRRRRVRLLLSGQPRLFRAMWWWWRRRRWRWSWWWCCYCGGVTLSAWWLCTVVGLCVVVVVAAVVVVTMVVVVVVVVAVMVVVLLLHLTRFMVLSPAMPLLPGKRLPSACHDDGTRLQELAHDGGTDALCATRDHDHVVREVEGDGHEGSKDPETKTSVLPPVRPQLLAQKKKKKKKKKTKCGHEHCKKHLSRAKQDTPAACIRFGAENSGAEVCRG
jgi:hypothetical protein